MSDPKTETAQHDRGLSWPTIDTVDLMLRQLERDKATAYWGAPPHADSLAGAEAWLLSLRDWLLTTPPATTDERCCPGAGSMAHVRGCINHPEAGR